MAVQLRTTEPAGTPPRDLAPGADTASRRAGEQPSRHSQASDAELARRARHGDGDAFTELARRYRPMMHRMAMAFFAPSEDLDDLLQAALIGLHAAAVTHREDARPFPSHAQMCVRRRLITHLKESLRLKHAPLNDALSLFRPSFDPDEGAALISEVPDASAASPEDDAIASVLRDEIPRIAREELTGMERSALLLLADGWTYAEIARRLGCGFKAVDNAVQRAREKLGRALRRAGWDVPAPRATARRRPAPAPDIPPHAALKPMHARIVELRRRGLTHREIVDALGVARSTVQEALKAATRLAG